MKKIPIDLQSLIDAQEYPFVLIDDHYNVVAANKAYSNHYGVEASAVVGHKCHRVSHHSEVPCHMNGEDCPHKQVFSTREPHQVLHIHYDAQDQPEHVRIKGSPVFGSDGSFYLGEAIFRLAKSSDLDCHDQRLIGRAPAFLASMEELARAAQSDAPVLIQGESGVGKDLAARYVHQRSTRSGRPFVTLDCSTVPDGMFENELFGHERGAFTGCVGRRIGLLDQADGGTLFLNAVDELPLAVQTRLLSALESGQYRRVGGRDILKADVRVITAATRDLRDQMNAEHFRSDLFYRLAGIIINLPPLRERREDIPALAEALLNRITSASKLHYQLDSTALAKLEDYDFPGNIRELRNILQGAVALCTDGIITREHLHRDMTSVAAPDNTAVGTPATQATLDEVEASHIAELLRQHAGHRARVAEALGISERTLYRKLKRYNLQDVGESSSAA